MFHRHRKLDDFSAEIEAHLEHEVARLREQGLSEGEARDMARREFGNVTKAQERFYESSRWVWWEQFWQDVRYGLRMLRKSPGFTAVAVLTLALGIGANTAIFSVVNAVLLRSLPYANPGQLVLVSEAKPDAGISGSGMSYPTFTELRDSNRAFSAIAGFGAHSLVLTGAGEPAEVSTVVVTPDFFSALAAEPLMGRGFVREDGELVAERLEGATELGLANGGVADNDRRIGALSGRLGGANGRQGENK